MTRRGASIMSLDKLVEKRIRQIFTDIAEDIGSGKIDVGDDPDFVAGIPLAIFMAETWLINAWRELMSGDEE